MRAAVAVPMLQAFAILLLVAGAMPLAECPHLDAPSPGPVLRDFAPVGSYGGHWGIDIAAPTGSPVAAAERGMVTFAGAVAGVLSVTVHHGGGLRTSYSYLSGIAVAPGRWVARGETLGLSGLDHELAAVHFSVRIGDVYQDPENWLGCFVAPSAGLSLVPTSDA